MEDKSVALKLEGITKRFPGLIANNTIDLAVQQGEIKCLLGENGAGKSTLMNIIYGLLKPDQGKIFVHGREMQFSSPREAILCGIGMVHQHFMLVPTFNPVENVVIGKGGTKRIVPDIRGAERKFKDLARRYDMKLDTRTKIWQMSVGEQQRVEILKALYHGANILILDEPTSVLTPSETEHLFRILDSLKKDGCSIIFITHKLWEATTISDTITVLKKGEVVGTVPTRETNAEMLALMMVGRREVYSLEKSETESGEAILKVDDVWAKDDKGLEALKGISLQVRRGEILGIAGVAGNGQRELAETISGLRQVLKGNIEFKGIETSGCSPRRIQKMGLAYIPEDRIHCGAGQDLTLQENLILKNYYRQPFSKKGFFQYSQIRKHSTALLEDYNVICQGPDSLAKQLSGGNLQKTILARELDAEPDFIIAEQPTSGLDIGAGEFVHNQLLESRNRGAGVLLISANLDEILRVSDRIAVIFEGQIMGVAQADEVEVQVLGQWMLGAEAKAGNDSVVK